MWRERFWKFGEYRPAKLVTYRVNVGFYLGISETRTSLYCTGSCSLLARNSDRKKKEKAREEKRPKPTKTRGWGDKYEWPPPQANCDVILNELLPTKQCQNFDPPPTFRTVGYMGPPLLSSTSFLFPIFYCHFFTQDHWRPRTPALMVYDTRGSYFLKKWRDVD